MFCRRAVLFLLFFILFFGNFLFFVSGIFLFVLWETSCVNFFHLYFQGGKKYLVSRVKRFLHFKALYLEFLTPLWTRYLTLLSHTQQRTLTLMSSNTPLRQSKTPALNMSRSNESPQPNRIAPRCVVCPRLTLLGFYISSDYQGPVTPHTFTVVCTTHTQTKTAWHNSSPCSFAWRSQFPHDCASLFWLLQREQPGSKQGLGHVVQCELWCSRHHAQQHAR